MLDYLDNIYETAKSWALAVWNTSWTKVWAYAQGLPALTILLLNALNSYITDPIIKGYLDKLEMPKWLTLGMVVTGLITYVAHGHAANK